MEWSYGPRSRPLAPHIPATAAIVGALAASILTSDQVVAWLRQVSLLLHGI